MSSDTGEHQVVFTAEQLPYLIGCEVRAANNTRVRLLDYRCSPDVRTGWVPMYYLDREIHPTRYVCAALDNSRLGNLRIVEVLSGPLAESGFNAAVKRYKQLTGAVC